jgi:hypothetical protein
MHNLEAVSVFRRRRGQYTPALGQRWVIGGNEREEEEDDGRKSTCRR